jgi:hypothetical protein
MGARKVAAAIGHMACPSARVEIVRNATQPTEASQKAFAAHFDPLRIEVSPEKMTNASEPRGRFHLYL